MTRKQWARLLARIALQKLADIEKGHSLRLLLWLDGSTGIVIGAGYAGKQDGDDPLIVLRREDYEDEIDPEDPEDIDILAEKIEDALSVKETKVANELKITLTLDTTSFRKALDEIERQAKEAIENITGQKVTIEAEGEQAIEEAGENVYYVRKMEECEFSKWEICSKCGRPISDPYFCKGKAYCKECYEDF